MAALTYYHVTPAGAGTKDGTTWAKAMGLAEFITSLQAASVDYTYFIAGGTYTLTGGIDSSAKNGTAIAPIALIGVKSTTTNKGSAVIYSDWAQGTDRPDFECGANVFRIGAYYVVRNIRLTGSATYLFQTATYCLIENCYFNQNYASAAARYCYNSATGCNVINCEFTSSKCYGLALSNYNAVLFCYFHNFLDTTYGIATGASGNIGDNIGFCIYANCNTTAILLGASQNCLIMNNTFYQNAIDVSASTGYGNVFINNIHEATTADAYKISTQTDINFFWKNHGNDARCTDMWDGVDITTVFQDYVVSTGDPKFTVAGSNFSLQPTSPNINNGMGEAMGVG